MITFFNFAGKLYMLFYRLDKITGISFTKRNTVATIATPPGVYIN